MPKYTRTDYPGVYLRERDGSFDACATVDGRQRWTCGYPTAELAAVAKLALLRAMKPGAVAFKTVKRNGRSLTATYLVWVHMIERCTKPTHPAFKNYGARGIAVCDRWRDSYDVFLADMGPRPEGRYPSGRARYSLDRIDNDGGYEPGNCRWTTQDVQIANQRRYHKRDKALA